jgi:small GTP-binding protein
MSETDYTYKIIVIGNSQAGKTSIVERYTSDSFTENQKTTIGVDFRVKIYDYDNRTFKIYIWDTAGQERFMTIVSSYYRTIHAVLLVFDLTDIESFNALSNWMNQLNSHKHDKQIQVVLVGNKADLNRDVVSESDILKFLKSSPFPISYMKASAKSNLNIDKIFSSIIENLYETNKPIKIKIMNLDTINHNDNIIKLSQYNSSKYGCGFC